MNIYFIPAKIIWPVGEAGAVVIAKSPASALKLAHGLYKPGAPEKIGTTSTKKEKVIFLNTTEY